MKCLNNCYACAFENDIKGCHKFLYDGLDFGDEEEDE